MPKLFTKTLQLPHCEIAHNNILDISNEQFAMLRRDGFGASDSSVILGLQSKWKTMDDIVLEKLRTTYTEEEAAVADKAVVRKGKDLEELVLSKAAAQLDTDLIKPDAMYRIIEAPWLTVSFDGVIEKSLIPVEAKVVTPYGDKYYNFNLQRPDMPIPQVPARTTIEYFEGMAASYGIPSYYYAQIQQQMLALNAPHGYLAALRDKDWTLYLFKIFRDAKAIDLLKVQTYQAWGRVERGRKHAQ